MQIEEQVAIQHDHIPREHREGEVEFPEPGNEVPETVGPAEIGGDEKEAHHDRRDGEQFTDDDHVVHVVVVVKIGRDDHHHAARGEADGEGEVRDVEAP